MIREIKRFFLHNRYTASYYHKLYHLKLEHKEKTDSIRLKIKGKKIVFVLQKVMERYRGIAFFDMGTMLGFVREGNFLKSDTDLDLGVVAVETQEKEKFRQCMIAEGAKLVLYVSIDRIGIVKEVYSLFGVKVDVQYYSHDHENKLSYCYLMYYPPETPKKDDSINVVRLKCPQINTTTKIDVMGISVNVPENPESYLSTRYGPTWNVPDPNYIYWKGPSAEQTDYIGQRFFVDI